MVTLNSKVLVSARQNKTRRPIGAGEFFNVLASTIVLERLKESDMHE
jgi:hypothetical protein